MPRRETDSPNWGGARPDAGRKPTGRTVKTASFSLPEQDVSAIALLATLYGKSKSEFLADFFARNGLRDEAANALSQRGHEAQQAKREAL